MDLSKEFTKVELAKWQGEGTTKGSLLRGSNDDLQLSPSGDLIAVSVREAGAGGGLGGGEQKHRLTLLHKSNGRRVVSSETASSSSPSSSSSFLPGHCEKYCWITEKRLVSASVSERDLRQKLRIYIHDIECKKKEVAAENVVFVRAVFDKHSSERKYILRREGQQRSYELEDCFSEFGVPKKVKLISSDLRHRTCVIVIENLNGTESCITLRSHKHYIQSCPVVQFSAKMAVKALCVKNQLIVAYCHSDLLYVWGLKDSATIWRHKMSRESNNTIGASATGSSTTSSSTSKLETHLSQRGKLVIAIGNPSGFITILEPIGCFSISIRRAAAAAANSTQQGAPSSSIFYVGSEFKNFHDFHCFCRRITVPASKFPCLRDLVFHCDKLLSVHSDERARKVFLSWSAMAPQSKESVEYGRQERVLVLEDTVSVHVSSDLLVFLESNSSLFCILPKVQKGKSVDYNKSSLFRNNLVEQAVYDRTNTDHYSWLADFLVAHSVEEIERLIELNGMCKGAGAKLMFMLQAILQRFNIDLLEKVVPELIKAKPEVWLSFARYLILEVIIYIFRYPSLRNSITQKVAKFLIQLLGQAHASGRRAESYELSKYLQALRALDTAKVSTGKSESRFTKEDEAGQEMKGEQDKFGILKAGLSANRVSEAVFKLLSNDLDNLDVSFASESQSDNIRMIINAYIIHLLQHGSLEEFQSSLDRLDISVRSVLEDIFWSAFTGSIRRRAMDHLHALDCLQEELLKVAKTAHIIQDVYQGKHSSFLAHYARKLNYDGILRSFASSLVPSHEPKFAADDTSPLGIHVDLGLKMKAEGLLGKFWPKKIICQSSEDLKNINIPMSGDGGGGEASVTNDIDSIPASWIAEWNEETIRKVVIEGMLLSSDDLPSDMISKHWESCLSYACEHDNIDLVLKLLSQVPDHAKCPGQLKVRINERGVTELSVTVFMPNLPHGLTSIVQNQVSYLLARHGIFKQLYWTSALKLIAFFEKTILMAQSENRLEEVQTIQDHLQTISAVYCSINKLPNLTVLHNRFATNTIHIEDTLRHTDDLSWCSWLPIAQDEKLCALSCALNTAIVCHLDVHTTEGNTIQAIGGMGNYLYSLPLLGFEPSESTRDKYFDSEFWTNFKRELLQNDRLSEKYPTLSSFLTKMSEGIVQFDEQANPPVSEDAFLVVRNALFTCSNQSSLLLTNFPSQLPQWTKKLIHLSTNVRQSRESGTPASPSSGGLEELFLKQERDVEKYIENEFFVLPYESSLNLKIQNHIMHGRSFASIYACLKSEETRAMIGKGATWEEIRISNDFVTLERTSCCSALSNFQDETVVSGCILVLQLISEDIYILQLLILVLRYIVLCIDNGLFTESSPFSGDSINDGYDFLTPIVQLICEDIKKGVKLSVDNTGILQLHEVIGTMLDKLLTKEESLHIQVATGFIDTRVSTWILLNALNEVYAFPKDNRYMIHLAEKNDWVQFLAEAERHGYTLKEVVSLSNFTNTDLKSHMERALLSSNDLNLDCGQEGSDSTPPELFQLVSESERQSSPGKFLLQACAELRWPFLAILSSCYDDVSKVKCFRYWLESTCISSSKGTSAAGHTIPHLVSILCQKKCYLPLIRAGETFFPKSIFVTFMYFLHSFMQIRLKDAESYLMQFKQMMKRERTNLDAEADWMIDSLIVALESSLASETSNSFLRNKTINMFEKCEVLQHFPNIQKLHVLYDVMGEDAYDDFVCWNPIDKENGDVLGEFGTEEEAHARPAFLTMDLEAAGYYLEDENKWREARLLFERCGLQAEDIVLKHAERILRDSQMKNIKMEVNVQSSWMDIHDLFVESNLSARRAGDYFFKQFDETVSYSTIGDSLFVLELAYKWYQGIYTNNEPCCSIEFIEEVMFRGLICRHVIAFENQQQSQMVEEDKWYIPKKSGHLDLNGSSAGVTGAFMIGSLEYQTLVYYMKSCGTKGMEDLLLTMLFNSFVWYGEIEFVKKLSSKLKEVKGIKFLEALVKILADHGGQEIKSTDSLSSNCLSYLLEVLSEHQVPHKVTDAVVFCAENIPHEVGLKFARRVSFSFKLSSVLESVNPKLILRSKPEETLQLLLRQGPSLLSHAEEFIQVYSVPPSKVASMLVRSFFKGLLVVHRDVSEEVSTASYEPAYSTEEFEKCAFLCTDKAELGHALLNIILTKHHLPSEFEVEVIILAYQYYESSHTMNGVDILTTLAFGRVYTYSSLGEFKAIVRLLNGIGQSKLRQYAIDKIVSSDKVELLLKKRSSNDSKERTVSRRRNLKREILSSIYQSCPDDSPTRSMALHHFNKTKLVAQGLIDQAEQALIGHAPKADAEANARAALLFSEASSIFQSIGCVKKALQSARQARELTKTMQ